MFLLDFFNLSCSAPKNLNGRNSSPIEQALTFEREEWTVSSQGRLAVLAAIISSSSTGPQGMRGRSWKEFSEEEAMVITEAETTRS